MKADMPMTPAQVTRGLAMRHYAWGKQIAQISDECGVPRQLLYDVIKGERFSEAVRVRLEGYLRTPAGPSALVQNNNRRWQGEDGRLRIDSERFRLLRRLMRARGLAKDYGLPLCRRERIKAMTATELKVYFYNLSDRVKVHIMSQDLSISRNWKLADDMEAWEFIERIDQLRALRNLKRASRDARRVELGAVRTQTRGPASPLVQLRGI
jgi:hypothetical protein